MATDTLDAIMQIGETAGQVWQYLDDQGPTTLTKLVKEIEAPRDSIMQAVGWLAREDKLLFDASGRTKTIRLRDEY